jgi:hypothetical protein
MTSSENSDKKNKFTSFEPKEKAQDYVDYASIALSENLLNGTSDYDFNEKSVSAKVNSP